MTDDSDLTGGLAALMRTKLRVRGHSLAQVAARAGRRVPRRVRKAAARLVAAEALAQNPKLRVTLDAQALAADRRTIETYLAEIDPADERRGWYLGILASLAINLLSLVALLVAVLIWRGYL